MEVRIELTFYVLQTYPKTNIGYSIIVPGVGLEPTFLSVRGYEPPLVPTPVYPGMVQ